MKVLIIGAGNIGRALEQLIKSARDNCEIEIFDKDKDKVPFRKDLAETAPSADFVFLAVPSSALEEVCAELKPILHLETIIISLIKGLAGEKRQIADKFFKENLAKKQALAFLFGPMLGDELKQGKRGVGVVATKNPENFEKLQILFKNSGLNLEYTSDLSGVAILGVLKNIYALGLGIADGLGWGMNMKGWLAASSMREMGDIIKMFGSRKDIVWGDAGLADLITTGFSPSSKNRRTGEELAKKGRNAELISEGIRSLPVIGGMLKDTPKTPVFKAIEETVKGNMPAEEAFRALIKGIFKH